LRLSRKRPLERGCGCAHRGEVNSAGSPRYQRHIYFDGPQH
jgi:hypothetical protein